LYVGTAINEDELDLYRRSHESWPTRLRRQGRTIAVGVAAFGTLVFILKTVSRSGKRVEV
jgi:hypothetical protein